MWHVSFGRDNFNLLRKKLNANFAHNKSSMKLLGFKNITLLYNLLLGETFSLLVWYVSENKVVVLKQFKKPCIYFKMFILFSLFYFCELNLSPLGRTKSQ